MSGRTGEDFTKILHGHTLSHFYKGASRKTGGAKYQADEIRCACGWHVRRQKVLSAAGRMALEARDIFQQRGAHHLWDVLERARKEETPGTGTEGLPHIDGTG